MAFGIPTFRLYIKKDNNASSDETISDTIYCDASLNENHTFTNSVTKIPIEDGSKITDHITIEPNQLELTLLFSDTPTSNYDITAQVDSSEGLAITKFKKVKAIRDDKKFVNIVSKIMTHQGMVIEKLGVARKSGDGKKVEVTALFTKVIRVTREGVATETAETNVDESVDHTAIGTIALGVITAGVGIGAVLDDLF